MFGTYLLATRLHYDTFPLCYGLSFKNATRFELCRLVSEDSPLISACADGDLEGVRYALQSGTGRPTDITGTGWNAMAYAIQSGNVEIVQTLLAYGAGVNWTFGNRQASPLHWAILHQRPDVVRFLLNQDGIDVDYTNVLGWNAYFMCWPVVQLGSPSALDMLTILANRYEPDLEATDVHNATVLQRVAACGSQQEVTRLLDMGADPLANANNNRWNAMQYAVDGGNLTAIETLLPCFGEDVRIMKDARGWTLLHIAASMGRESTIKWLILHGCQIDALSKACQYRVPESLRCRQYTPRDVAAAGKPQALATFDGVLRDLGISVVGEDDETFWDAAEA